MPVVDVSVLSATDISGTSPKKSFCVYVRLQGQAIRTKPTSGDSSGTVNFGERFRFQYQPDPRRPGRNRMFAELWSKSLFSQTCVSIAWIEMDQQQLVRGQQTRVNLRGTFESKGATISLVITPLDFGETPGMAPPNSYEQQQPGYPSLPQGPYAPYPAAPGNSYPMPPPGMNYNSGPAQGVPLAPSQDPYTTASYFPNASPVMPESSNSTCHQCEAAPLPPPQPGAFVGASLPPPLYSGLSLPQSQQRQGNNEEQPLFQEALPAPSPQALYNYGGGSPQKPKEV